MRKWKKSSMKLTNQTKFKETELGLIPKDWVVLRFDQIAELKKEGYFPKLGDNLPYLGLEHIDQQTLSINSIGSSDDVNSNKSRFKSGDILFGKLRPYFKKIYRPKFDGVCSTDIWVINAKKGVDQEWLHWFVANQDFVDMASSGSKGTKMPRADWGQVSISEWPVPPPEEQQKIAEVLGALDEKIELNRKMNKTLESLAQAVFKKWFIDDADPNWKTGKIGDISEEVLRGFTTSYVEKSNLINLNQKVNRGEYLDESNFKYYADDTIVPKNKFAKRGDILINSLGQGTLGRVHFYLEDTDNVVVDQHITIIRTGAAKLKPEYLYYYLTNCCDLESLITGSTGMLMLNISHIRNFEIQIPNIKIQNKFSTFVQSLNDKKSFNNKEIKSLSQIRDSLLPRLMSGKLRVK